MNSQPSLDVDILQRWQDAGSIWRVIGGGGEVTTVGLYRCDGGEEVDRLVSTDVRLVEWLGDRRSSEDPVPAVEPSSPSALLAPRDRDTDGRARQARPRDALGRPLPYGSPGVEPFDDRVLSPTEALSVARQYLAAGRPFAAHEVLEGQWKACPTEERALWQGLAQLCVAMTHAKRGNELGARTVLARSVGHLRSSISVNGQTYGSDVHGIDVHEIVTWIDAPHPPGDLSWLETPPL